MKTQKVLWLNVELVAKLKDEKNASKLITQLLNKHYGITSKD